MKVVMLDAPEELIAERRRKGLDHRDELWDGVLHMVPQPGEWHQGFNFKLLMALDPLAESKGLVVRPEISIHRPGRVDKDYRVPDAIICRPSQLTRRGVVGACELVIEVLSPNDETYEKIPFYSELGVRELLVFEPDKRDVELYTRRRGRLVKTGKNAVRSKVLGVSFAKVRGPKLKLTGPELEAFI